MNKKYAQLLIKLRMYGLKIERESYDKIKFTKFNNTK